MQRGLNLHENFVNLNAEYDVRKFNRVKAEVDLMKEKLSSNLMNQYKTIHRKNFNDFVSKGGRLTIK